MNVKADKPIPDADFKGSDPKFNSKKIIADRIPDGISDSKALLAIRRIELRIRYHQFKSLEWQLNLHLSHAKLPIRSLHNTSVSIARFRYSSPLLVDIDSDVLIPKSSYFESPAKCKITSSISNIT